MGNSAVCTVGVASAGFSFSLAAVNRFDGRSSFRSSNLHNSCGMFRSGPMVLTRSLLIVRPPCSVNRLIVPADSPGQAPASSPPTTLSPALPHLPPTSPPSSSVPCMIIMIVHVALCHQPCRCSITPCCRKNAILGFLLSQIRGIPIAYAAASAYF